MRNLLQPVTCITLACSFALTIGCKSKPAPPAAAAPAPKPVLMDAATRATTAAAAQQHPTFKVFLQQPELPTILVVAETTTDAQLKDLLWYLRTEVQSGHFKELGIHPTTTVFDIPSYSSGTLNIYRGTNCAREMYITSGLDPCGPSIHKAAAYHWGNAGDPRSDSADIVSSTGDDAILFTSADGWQTNEEAQADPNGTLRKAAHERINYTTTQNAEQIKQVTDIRFYIDQPNDELGIISYQLATPEAQKSFLTQYLTLEQDHLCPLGFKSIKLGIRGKPGTSYPIDCTTTKP